MATSAASHLIVKNSECMAPWAKPWVSARACLSKAVSLVPSPSRAIASSRTIERLQQGAQGSGLSFEALGHVSC